MTNKTLRYVREKLFSTKDASEKMNDEIKNSVKRIREQQLRRLKPSQFNDESYMLSDEDYQKVAELADFITTYINETGEEQAICRSGPRSASDAKSSILRK